MTSATRPCSSRRRRYERPSYAASRMSAWRNRNAPGTFGSRSTNSPSRSHASDACADLGSSSRTSAISDAGERDSEHGRPAKERAIAGGELVDARRDECLDRLGKLLGLVGLLADARQPLEEQRVAGAALHERGELVVGQPTVTRCGDGERLRVLRGQRLEPQRQGGQRRRSLGGGESVLARTPRRAGEPRPRRKLRSEVAKELGRRVVHPVDVVEHQQRRRVEEVPEERAHDAVEACAPEGRVEVAHLGRRLDLDVERGREQRRPGHELLVDLLEPRSPRTARLCCPPPFSSTSSSERRNGRNG